MLARIGWLAAPMLGIVQAEELHLEAVTATLDAEIRRRMESNGIPSIAIALVRGDRVVWKQAYGVSNVHSKAPATAATVYPIGSLCKPITATAVLQLVERGKCSLDDPVNTFLGEDAIPSAPGAVEPIRIRHLLSHTAGLPNGGAVAPVWERDLPEPLDLLVRRLRVDRPPGELVSYSSSGFALAGWIVSSISGMPFEEYVARNVFDPLEMSTATFAPTPEIVERLALPYGRGALGVVPRPQLRLDVYPAGDAYASVEDLAHLLIAHLNSGAFRGKRILRPESVQRMHAREPLRGGEGGMGLAFSVSEHGGRTVIAQNGAVLGVAATLRADLTARTGVVILSNLDTAGSTVAALAEIALKRMRGEPYARFELATARRDPLPESWTRYAGVYEAPGRAAEVWLEEGALRIARDASRHYLVPAADGSFLLSGDDVVEPAPVSFEVRDAGAVAMRIGGDEPLPRVARPSAARLNRALAPEGDFSGTWDGAIQVSAARVPFRLRTSRGASGLTATIDVPSLGVAAAPLSAVAHHGRVVHFEFVAGHLYSVFEGALESDALRGEVRQGNVAYPVEAFRVDAAAAAASSAPTKPATLLGHWEGQVEGATRVRIHLDVASETEATVDLPEQNVVRRPVEKLRRSGNRVTFEIAMPRRRSTFTGVLMGEILRGHVEENGERASVHLRRR